MTPSPALQALLAKLPTDGLEFSDLLIAVEQARFTGPVTIDFFNGNPRQINLGQPVKLTICHATTDELPAKPLDRGRPSRAR